MIAALVPIIAINASAADYNKVTAAEGTSIEDGSYLITVNVNSTKYAVTGSYESKWITVTKENSGWTSSDASVTTDTANLVWTVAKVAGMEYYTLQMSDGNYIKWTTGQNAIGTSATTNNNCYWTIVAQDDGTVKFLSTDGTVRLSTNNTSGSKIRAYKTTTTGSSYTDVFTLYKLAPSCPHTNTEAIGEAKNASCTEDGITAGSKCSDCGEVVTQQETIPATGHIDENPVDNKCDTCGKSLCTNHVWVDGEVITAPTCTETGLQEQVCENCGEPGEDKVLDALGHTVVVDAAVEVTCTTDGKTEGSHCSVCDEVLVAQTVIPAGHKFDDGICTVCGCDIPLEYTFDYTTGTNAVTPEDVTEYLVKLTFDDGAKWYSNGNAIRFYQNDTLTISTVEGYYIKKITLTITQGSFSADSDTLTGGTWTTDSKEIKSVIFTNPNSSQSRINNIVVELGADCKHTNTTAIGEAKNASCTEDGITAGVKCADCGEVVTQQETIPATGHIDADNNKYCDNCGNTFCGENHTYEEYISTPATCTEPGEKELKCSVCDEVLENSQTVIEATGHSWITDAPAVAPTCTTNGTTEAKHCEKCDEVVEATVVSALKHSYSDGLCTVCGEREPIYTLVTDASKLKPGDKIIIVSCENGSAMGEEGSNNRGQIPITKNGNNIALVDGVQVLTLEAGNIAGTFAFYTGLGYLYAASSSSNHLKTQYTLDDNGSWTITIADGIATITAQGDNSHNLLQYNETSKLFSAYVKDQKDIAIYKYNDPTIDSMNVVLNKGVTVNVKIHITAEWLALNPGAQIKFNCGENSKVYDLKAGDNVYSVQLTPAQINDVLTAEVINGNGDVVISKDVSIDTYKTKIESSTYTDLGISEAKYIALVKLLEATVNYSKVARGETVALTVPEYFTAAGNDFSVSDTNTVFLGFSGKLSTYASIYVTLQTGVSAEAPLSVKRGETALVPENSVIGTYINENDQIVLSGLYALNFDDEHVISSAESSVTFSMNSYLKAVYNAGSSTESVKNMAVATYLYGVAAEAFNSAK